MKALSVIAEPVERPGRAMVFCPHCFIECAVPAGRSLAGVACMRCLRPLAPEPDRSRVPALRETAGWWDRAQAGGAGFGIVVCPHCGVSCVVPTGRAVTATGCTGCLRPLGAGPLLRYDLTPRAIPRAARVRALPPAA